MEGRLCGRGTRMGDPGYPWEYVMAYLNNCVGWQGGKTPY